MSSATHPTDLPDAVRILMYECFSPPQYTSRGHSMTSPS
jgi:hypothetical protein